MEKNRGAKLLIRLLVSIDQFFHVLLWGIYYVFFGGEKPSEDETISSKVGRYAMQGNKVALFLEKPINFIFELLGEKNHCRNKIEWDEIPKG